MFLTGLLVGVTIGAAAFCFPAYAASRKALMSSILCDCIAKMCGQPSIETATAVAEATRQRLVVMGLWKSGD
jgi:hypothetical protein